MSQTFEVKPSTPAASGKKQKPGSPGSAAAPSQGLGWGSSIEVARQARAAQDALKKGNYTAAAEFAERAAKAAPQNTELWFLAGYASRLADRYQASVDAYTRGLKNQPNSSKGLAGLAQTYIKMGRNDEARQLLVRVVEANPKDATSLGLAGELLLNSDTRQALEYLRRADAVQASAHNELLIARAYQNLGQKQESQQYLARAKSRAPHDPEVLRAIAGVYRESGQYDLAISTLRGLGSKNPDIVAELGYTYQMAGKQQEAAAAYTQAAKAAKGNVGLQLSAAQALVSLGQAQAARGFLDRARELNPDHYRLHAILAQLASSESKYSDAINEYQLALKNVPHSAPEGPLYPVDLRLNLYELYQQTNKPNDAQQQLRLASDELQQVGGQNVPRPEFLRLRAAVEAASGNLDAADKDLKEALALNPSNVNFILNYGTVLWKLGQKDMARTMFQKALQLDPKNRLALISLGYLARDGGDVKQAEVYFTKAVQLYPKEFAPHFALGDLYSAERKFPAAEEQYDAAIRLMPTNPLIVAGATNAALESHNLELAKRWLDKATGDMNKSPQLMRERQRYLTWKGQYQEAAVLGQKVLEQLPRDPEAPVYLAYDLYYTGKYQEAFDLATKYDSILPNNRDLALIQGYVHARAKQYQEAEDDFTRALQRDPKMATGYANRGFIRNDLRKPADAARDFQKAIQLQPDYPEAHLGLGYAYLQLHRPQPALEELDLAEKSLGQTRPWHLARAEGFRQEQKFANAEKEYRAALAETPDDLTTQLALAETLYRLHRYNDSIATLGVAQKLAPTEPTIYSQTALNYAKLGQRDQAIKNVQLAEQYGNNSSAILMATGMVFLDMGDRDAAMQRFSRALDSPEGTVVATRLAIAHVFVQDGRFDDARRQVGLAFAEARVDENQEVTPDDFVEAANVLLAVHDFDLARTYFDKARQAGASPRTVAIGLANTYLAEGDSRAADQELAGLGNADEYKDDYDYQMARANLFRQRQDTVHALSAFAQASTLASQDDQQTALNAQYQVAQQEGRRITPNLSLFSEASFSPVFEDINIYALDAQLLGVTDPKLLPTPRHSYQSFAAEHYRVHLKNLPAISGLVGESMTRGEISFPSNEVIQDRNTLDTIMNGGISPVLHLGSNTLAFNGGLQFTIRRDTISPEAMNQNLFRQYLYLSTSSFFNWVSVHGSVIREAGPFTDQTLHSRDASGRLEFTVGRPWGRTSLLAGYFGRDLLFRPLIREYYTTSTYAGIQRKFGERFTLAVLGEYIRSWRVQDNRFAIAQAMRPAARFEYKPNPRWSVQGSFALSRGEGFHFYDNAQGEFMVSYVRPWQRSLADAGGSVPVSYPLTFSFGVQQQTFYNFGGQSTTTVLPVVRLTLF